MSKKKKLISSFTAEELKLQIEQVEITKLKSYEKNAKIHTEKQVTKLVQSIKRFGMINPILIDSNFTIVAGHGRLEALKQLGYKNIPVIMVEHLTESQIRAFRLADNRIAEDAEYNLDLLKVELEELSFIEDFSITDTGYEIAEIDSIIIDDYSRKKDKPDNADSLKNLKIEEKVKFGDIWQLGKHRILCGDATIEEHYKELLQDEIADIIITDPPYNVPIKGHVCKTEHEEFAMASGEMTDEEFAEFTEKFMQNLVHFSRSGSLHYIFIDWRGIKIFLNVGDNIYHALKNICVWNKLVGGMGSTYRSQHEFVCVFKNGNKPHQNNIALGKNGRYRTNVWDHKGVSATNPKSLKLLKMHPTVKPVGLLHEILLDTSCIGDIVLDPFGGSGSTLIASERAKRKARLIEISPKYCNLILHRYEEIFNQKAKFVRNIISKKENENDK